MNEISIPPLDRHKGERRKERSLSPNGYPNVDTLPAMLRISLTFNYVGEKGDGSALLQTSLRRQNQCFLACHNVESVAAALPLLLDHIKQMIRLDHPPPPPPPLPPIPSSSLPPRNRFRIVFYHYFLSR